MAPASLIKRTLQDTSLPSNMSPFKTYLGHKRRATLDNLMPHVYDTELRVDLDAFVEQRKQILREVRQALDNGYRGEVAKRQKINAETTRPSTGVSVKPRDLVLVKENSIDIYRKNSRGDLKQEKWTGRCKVPQSHMKSV